MQQQDQEGNGGHQELAHNGEQGQRRIWSDRVGTMDESPVEPRFKASYKRGAKDIKERQRVYRRAMVSKEEGTVSIEW